MNMRPTLYSQSKIPLKDGLFEFCVFKFPNNTNEVLVIYKGDLNTLNPLFLRIHSECVTSEVFGSLKCDCKDQLDSALTQIAKIDSGMIIYLKQEGRGIGIGEKIKAYALQENGLNTIEANQVLGHPIDLRSYQSAALILDYFKIKQVILNTNNPDKIKQLQDNGIEVTKIQPSLMPINPHNHQYIKVKKEILGHHL